MTYATEEASEDSGGPIELYKFVGTSNTYRYTSAENDVVFDDGGGDETYTAVPIQRTDPVIKPDGGAPELSVSMSVNQGLVHAYVFQIAPPDLYLTVYRKHEGSAFNIVLWEGEVMTWSVDGDIATCVVPNELTARVQEELPRARYQPYCNNVLYDAICTVPRAGNDQATTITSFSGDGRTVNVASMGARPNDWAHGGELTHDATGESRMVINHTGNALEILYPFSVDVEVSDAVTVYQGCDHTLNDCVNTFNNQDNFNGMPFIISQALNPTQDGE